MPGQSCPSLALPLGSICCLWDDVKRNLPLLQFWTWKLSLMEARGKSVGFSALHIGFNSNANIILPKSDLIFHRPFPHFWVLVSNEHLICSHRIWTAINICCKGSNKGCAAPAPACWFLFCTSPAQHNATAWLFFASRNQSPRRQMPRRHCVNSAGSWTFPIGEVRITKAKSLGRSF